jgi:hypothetical protein
MGRPTIRVELTDSNVARELAAGSVFVRGCELPLHELCELVVSDAGRDLRLDAVVVYTQDQGAGVQVVGFGPELQAQVSEFITTAAELARAFDALDRLGEFEAEDGPRSDQPDDALPDIDLGVVVRFHAPAALDEVRSSDDRDERSGDLADLEPRTEPEARLGYRISSPSWEVRAAMHGVEVRSSEDDVRDPDAGVREPDESGVGSDEPVPEPTAESGGADGEAGAEQQRKALTMHERLRRLTIGEQLKKAHSSDPSERILLERIYGKNVWEALLRNPRLTAPEVVRLARMGTLPRPLLELIVANGGWLQIPEVRRALLTNPRLGTDQILRVLRLLPKHELKVASTTTAYPFAVRDAAKRMVRGD